MICSWCKGSGEECGCGHGHCMHCENGETTTPPIGDPITMMDTDFYYNLPRDFFKSILGFRGGVRTPHQTIENVSLVMYGEQRLTDEEIQKMKDYWDSPYRDETIGEVIARIAKYIKR